MNEEDAVLIPKKSRRELFQWIFALKIFWGGVSRYAAIDCCFVTNRDRKSFGSHRKNSKSYSQITGTVDIFDLHSGILGPTLWRASACPNLHE